MGIKATSIKLKYRSKRGQRDKILAGINKRIVIKQRRINSQIVAGSRGDC